MRQPVEFKLFVKDLRILLSRGKDLNKVKNIVELLCSGDNLPHNARPHKLKGEYEGFWECHIEGDWVIIYTYNDKTLFLHRTGRHQDLFRKY